MTIHVVLVALLDVYACFDVVWNEAAGCLVAPHPIASYAFRGQSDPCVSSYVMITATACRTYRDKQQFRILQVGVLNIC